MANDSLFVSDLFNEVMPLIENTYRASPQPEMRPSAMAMTVPLELVTKGVAASEALGQLAGEAVRTATRWTQSTFLEDRARALIRPWTKYITEGASYLALKLAISGGLLYWAFRSVEPILEVVRSDGLK